MYEAVLSVAVSVFVPFTSDGVLLVCSVVVFVLHCVTVSGKAPERLLGGFGGKLCACCVCFGCMRLF